MTKQRRSVLIAAAALAAALAGCGDSGGGPLHHPDVSVKGVVGAAVGQLTPRAAPDPAGSVLVLDHLDPSTIMGRPELPEFITQALFSPELAAGPTDPLPDAVRNAIAAALPGQDVSFTPADPAPGAPDDPGCDGSQTGTFIRFAMLPTGAVHGDVFLVVSETDDGCGGMFWAAARVLWQPGGLVGGDWVLGELLGGAVTVP